MRFESCGGLAFMIDSCTMNRWTFARWQVGMFLLLAACKTTPPVEELPTFVPFELLDAGAEPRSPLRYVIAEGTKTTSRVTWEAKIREGGPTRETVLGLESVEIVVEYGPSTRVEEGTRYPIEIVEAKVVKAMSANESAVENLVGTGGRITFDDRGQLLGGRYNKNAGVPLRLWLDIENTLATIDFIVLPEEDVGMGARWVSRATMVSYGLEMAQEAVYELVERNGNDVVIDVTLRRTGDEQLLEGSARQSMEIVSNRINGAGRMRLDLTALASNTTATFTVRSELVLVEDNRREVLNVDETVAVEVQSKTTKPEASAP